MGALEDVRERVGSLATLLAIPEHRAFGQWFLEDVEEFSEEEARDVITDGPWDGGRDAVYRDDSNSTLRIYQFKYSTDRHYVRRAQRDIQRAVKIEAPNLGSLSSIKLIVVTLSTADEGVHRTYQKIKSNITEWLSNHGHKNVHLEIELFDLRKFSQLLDKLYGVDLVAHFCGGAIEVDNSVIGLLDARDLSKHVAEDELFAFNIRKFLGARKGSVNSQILDSLEDNDQRKTFWKLNNGIVCVCSGASKGRKGSFHFTNFTIVNGAQTVNVISRYLEENVAVEEPVWVLAKIMTVDQEDVDRAILLTKTSNTQTPTNNRDLRAVDTIHTSLARWFDTHLGVNYIFKRGGKSVRGGKNIRMKDLSQAFIAWEGDPQTSFANPGKIFELNDIYDKVFPLARIQGLRETGSPSEIIAFLESRVLPHDLLIAIRSRLAEKCGTPDSRRWRSLAYHMVFLYGRLLGEAGRESLTDLIPLVDSIVSSTFDMVFEGLHDYCEARSMTIPKDLKASTLTEAIAGTRLQSFSWFVKAQAQVDGFIRPMGIASSTGSPPEDSDRPTAG